MVTLEIMLDVEAAQRSAESFQSKIVQELKEAASKGEGAFKSFANKTDKELEKLFQDAKRHAKELSDEQKRAADNSKKAWEGFARNTLGFLNDLKDLTGMVSQSLFGMSKETSEAVGHAEDLVLKGAAIGSTFGPAGSVVGALSGALLSAAESMQKLRQTLPQTAQKVEELTTGSKASEKSFFDLSAQARGFDVLLGQISPHQESINRVLESFGAPGKGAVFIMEQLGLKAADLKTEAQDLAKLMSMEVFNNSVLLGALTGASVGVTRKTPGEDPSKKRVDAINESLRKTQELFAAGQEGRETMLDLAGMKDTFLDAAEGFDAFQQAEDPNRLKQIADELERMQKALDVKKAAESIAEMSKEVESIEQIVARVKAANQAKFFEKLSDEVKAFGNQVASSLGGQAGAAAERFFDSIAKGEARSSEARKKARLQFLRETGETLVADGVKNEFIGGGQALSGIDVPGGLALMAWGGAEILSGIGLGSSAARAQRARGFGHESSGTSSTSGNLGRGNNSSSGPVVSTPVIINLQSLLPADKRQAQEIGRQVENARAAYNGGR